MGCKQYKIHLCTQDHPLETDESKNNSSPFFGTFLFLGSFVFVPQKESKPKKRIASKCSRSFQFSPMHIYIILYTEVIQSPYFSREKGVTFIPILWAILSFLHNLQNISTNRHSSPKVRRNLINLSLVDNNSILQTYYF